MKEKLFRESLKLLKEVKRDLSRDAQDCAVQRIDEVIDRMEQALDDGSYKSIPPTELLSHLSQILPAIGRIAGLIDTILKMIP